jgi:DNA invertase Pin-like site-specific DNA recombinase
MYQAAIYARYSTSDQRETSIEDQARRCKELAERSGYEVPEGLIYSDSAISGSAKSLKKRVGYQQMLSALDDGKFQCLVVDEISRIGRDHDELARLQKVIERTGVRLLSADGTDSQNPNWQLPFLIMSAIGQSSLRETAHRVKRSMVGQLERGYMIASPAFGYKLKRFMNEDGRRIGSTWEIDEIESGIVKGMYKMRKEGKSYAGIARDLNTKGVKTPRGAHDGTPGHWRQGTVYRMLSNTIYRGVFMWNGSQSFAAKAKKEKWVPKPVEYYHPELRLVDDDAWNICTKGRISRTGYGGGKHMFAGLVTCIFCENILTVSSQNNKVRTLYCAKCTSARNVSASTRIGPGYISTAGIEALLKHILAQVLDDPEFVGIFRERLKSRIDEGSDGELKELEDKFTTADKASIRLSRALTNAGDDDRVENELKLVITRKKQLEAQIWELKSRMFKQDKSMITKQLQTTPSRVLPMIFGSSASPEKVRSILSRLFPEIIALGKSSRFESRFKVSIAPGVAFAEASGTKEVETGSIVKTFKVKTTPNRPVVWTVSQV